MALAPWGVLAAGKIRSDEEEERRRRTGEGGRTMLSADWERTESEKKVCDALEVVAKEIGAKEITSGEYRLSAKRQASGYRLTHASSRDSLCDA
jgi:hypothetical protein